MIRNYIYIAWRKVQQNPLYAFINIFSLAIGLASCTVIYLFIEDERSFDNFHSNKENIYRLNQIQNFSGMDTHKVPLSMPAMGPFIWKEFPEIATYTRVHNRQKQLVVKGDKQFLIPRLAYVDSTFLEIFDFELLYGDRSKALDEPNSIMVTKATALKFFTTTEEAMGSTLSYMGGEHKITGILQNIPENSHLQFDVLISMATFTKNFNNSWRGSLTTYLVLHPETNVKSVEEKFPSFLRRHMNDPDMSNRIVLYLQRLDQVHLASTNIEHDDNNYRKFDGDHLDIFAIVGVFILFIAGVNFTNLTIARASYRSKEIGVRKIVGAKKAGLFAQFMLESVMFSFFAIILAALLILLFIPMINDIIGRELSFTLLLNEPVNILYIIFSALALGLLTGIYPSFYMTSFNIVRGLKGGSQGDRQSFFRSGLVVLQFSLALAMIVSTLIVVQQISYMKNKDLGFNKEQMMLIKMDVEASNKFEMLRTELKRSSLILGVTASSGISKVGNKQEFKVKSDNEVIKITPYKMNVDYEYLSVYGIQLKDGRNFSKDISSDIGRSFIINESLARELGLKETVGAPAGPGWFHNDSLGTIIGVVKDFNYQSLHHKIYPIEMEWHPEWGYTEMSVKIDGTRASEAIQFVKNLLDQHVDYPFDYSFLDEHFETIYRSDQQLGAVVTVMAGLAILISCMGLFGLAAITTERKTKEIGIRKVLGATEGQILRLLSGSFALLILISFLLASPVTYWMLSAWLANFEYRVSIDPLVFLTGWFIAFSVAMLTITHHTLTSARANPVKALRYE